MSYHASSSEEYWSNFIESVVETICDSLGSIANNLDRIATQLEENAIENTGELASVRYAEEENNDG